MQTAVRKISFCYGHRVMNHESRCANLHGHNAIIWVHATPVQTLDSLGRVIDFSVLKSKLGGWIDEHWDHTMILFKDDLKTISLVEQVEHNKPIYLLANNPTAENLCHYLLWDICPSLFKDSGVIIHKIIFWETENCFAEEELDPKGETIRSLYQIKE